MHNPNTTTAGPAGPFDEPSAGLGDGTSAGTPIGQPSPDAAHSSGDFSGWIGRSEQVHDPLSWTQAQAAQAMLDEAALPLADGDALPLPWHWFYFLPRATQAALDADGHPQRGGFLPPIPYPRRMFAGARIQVHQPLRLGVPALRKGTIRSVVMKSGKSGSLAFVTVAYRFTQAGVLCLEEEQDIVYREADAPAVPAVPAVPVFAAAPTSLPAPASAALPPPPAGAWMRTWQPDTRLLFRFSALTFNAHRIHYDRPYATAVEGYPGLVVHGPLTAVMLLQLVRQSTSRPVRAFSFRGVAPLFDLGPVRLLATAGGEQVALEAQGPDGRAGLLATVTLGTL